MKVLNCVFEEKLFIIWMKKNLFPFVCQWKNDNEEDLTVVFLDEWFKSYSKS